MEAIVIARILAALGLTRAAQMHDEMVQIFQTEKENPALVGQMTFGSNQFSYPRRLNSPQQPQTELDTFRRL